MRIRTDHLHDLDDEGALVEQAFLFGGVLAVDGVERVLRLLQRGVVLLVLVSREREREREREIGEKFRGLLLGALHTNSYPSQTRFFSSAT